MDEVNNADDDQALPLPKLEVAVCTNRRFYFDAVSIIPSFGSK